MKGIVFTELCEMIEEKFGIEMLNEILSNKSLKSKGVYTAIDTYGHGELVKIVNDLSEKTNSEAQSLIHSYGRYFFATLEENHGRFFDKMNTFSFLKSVDGHIHREVRKMYHDAELPHFSYEESENTLIMLYKSPRKLYSFALGLIEKSLEYFKENISLSYELLKEDGSEVKFTLVKNV